MLSYDNWSIFKAAWPELALALVTENPGVFESEDIDADIGGCIRVAESREDLGSLLDAAGKPITEGGNDFDMKSSLTENFTQVLLVTNDAGGDLWLIPSNLLSE